MDSDVVSVLCTESVYWDDSYLYDCSVTASLKEQLTAFCYKKKEKTIFYHLEATTVNSLVVFPNLFLLFLVFLFHHYRVIF